MIGDSLMDGAHEVRALSIEFEGEVAFGVGLGASGFLHALAELEQDDFVARAGLAGGAVFHRAGEGLGGSGCGEEKDGENTADRDVLTGDTPRRERGARPDESAKGHGVLRLRENCALRTSRCAQDDSARGILHHSFQDLAPLGADAFASKRAISASNVAASSCREDLSEA